MESSKTIKEMKAIKNLLYIIVICLLLILLKPELLSMNLYQTQSSQKPHKQSLHKVNEPLPSIWSVELVKDTFERGKLEIVVEMCNNRIQEYPNDAYGYWYRAKAFKMLDENQKALFDLDKAELNIRIHCEKIF